MRRRGLLGVITPLALALTACGTTQTKTVTVSGSAAATNTTAAASATTAAPAPKPVVEVDWNSPRTTTQNRVTLKGTVTYGAHVKVGGQRAALFGTKWSKVVRLSKRGENVFHVTATKKGYESAELELSVTRKLSAAEKAVIRKQEADRRAGARALDSARSYLELGSFSKKGLYEQLSSSAGEGFSASQAQYAVDHVGADWKKEAVEAARSYLQQGSFSRSALIEQLSSSAGEGFTYEEALYAVNKVY